MTTRLRVPLIDKGCSTGLEKVHRERPSVGSHAGLMVVNAAVVRLVDSWDAKRIINETNF